MRNNGNYTECCLRAKLVGSLRLINPILDAMAVFRRTHLSWAEGYIHHHTDDPHGTGDTAHMRWAQQLIDETRMARMQTR